MFMYTATHVYVRGHTDLCICPHMSMYTATCMFVYMVTHTYTHAHTTHTCLCTRQHACLCTWLHTSMHMPAPHKHMSMNMATRARTRTRVCVHGHTRVPHPPGHLFWHDRHSQPLPRGRPERGSLFFLRGSFFFAFGACRRRAPRAATDPEVVLARSRRGEPARIPSAFTVGILRGAIKGTHDRPREQVKPKAPSYQASSLCVDGQDYRHACRQVYEANG